MGTSTCTKTRVNFRQIGEWKFWHSKETLSLPEKNLLEAEKIVSAFSDSYPVKKTWVKENFGVPTLILRMDCSILNGHLNPYKIDECPDGIAALKEINPKFCSVLNRSQNRWPKLRALRNSFSQSYDDNLWLEEINPDEALKNPGLLLIRAKSEEDVPEHFKKWLAHPLISQDDESCALKMGLWKEVNLNDFDILDWQGGFCLRARNNSESAEIEIWHPQKNKFQGQGICGFSTKLKIENALKENKQMFYQPFIMPMKSPSDKKMVYRLFFVFNLSGGMKYEYAGGIWIERPNIVINRAEDSIIGPVN